VARAVDERDARVLSARTPHGRRMPNGIVPRARAALLGGALATLATLAACAPSVVPPPAPAPVPTPTTTSTTTTTVVAPAPVAAPAPSPDGPPLACAAAADSLLVDVARVDSTVRVELRYATPYNFTGAVLPGYEAPRALLRREAAQALARVQAALKADSLGLKIYDAYRPVRATDAMVAWTRRVNREDLLRDGYIAERSKHNLGLAVDLTLVDLRTGRELKMGTAFDTFAPSAHTANATGETAANRLRLKRAMEAEGFTNLAEEWWHYAFPVPDPMRFDLVIR
jgi:D-alanyl-D-alanine dipeptidase